MPPNSKFCSFENDSWPHNFKVSVWKICQLRSIFKVVCVCDFIKSDRKCVFIIVLGDRLNRATKVTCPFDISIIPIHWIIKSSDMHFSCRVLKHRSFELIKPYAHECHIPVDRDAFWPCKSKRCIDVETQIKCKQPILTHYIFTAAPLYVEWIIHSLRRNKLVPTLM